jgi:hypothetical protein
LLKHSLPAAQIAPFAFFADSPGTFGISFPDELSSEPHPPKTSIHMDEMIAMAVIDIFLIVVPY